MEKIQIVVVSSLATYFTYSTYQCKYDYEYNIDLPNHPPSVIIHHTLIFFTASILS